MSSRAEKQPRVQGTVAPGFESVKRVYEQEMQTMGEMDDAIEAHLATCMGKLSEKSRRLVKGYYHEERSPETLSEREGRSVEAIYKTIQRARRDLQACIERQIRKAQA